MSLSATVWAMEQVCRSPLEKLALIYLSDRVGENGRCDTSIANMEQFCCAPEAELATAILDLDERGLLQLFGSSGGRLDVAFPWYLPDVKKSVVEADPTIIRYTRAGLWEEQQGLCWYCGCGIHADPSIEPYAQLEHQHPRSRGGRSSKENIVLACRPCNIRKKDKTVDEFRVWLEAREGRAVVFHGERA